MRDLKLCSSPKNETEVEKILKNRDFCIVATQKPFSSLFSWVNSVSLTHGIKWTSCTVQGCIGLVGPTVIPRETPCYTCYQMRKRSNLIHYEEFVDFEEYLKNHPESEKTYGALVNTLSLLANLTVLEMVKLITGNGTTITAGSQFSFDPLSLETEIHPILKYFLTVKNKVIDNKKRTMKVWMQ